MPCDNCGHLKLCDACAQRARLKAVELARQLFDVAHGQRNDDDYYPEAVALLCPAIEAAPDEKRSPSSLLDRAVEWREWVTKRVAAGTLTGADIQKSIYKLLRTVHAEALKEARAKVLAATDHADCNTCEVLRAVAADLYGDTEP